MSTIYIAGVGMTPFTRHPELSVGQLTAWAVRETLEDAGCAPEQVQSAFFGNCAQGLLEGQHLVRGQMSLLPMGLQGIPIFNVENACATASTALHLAVQYLRAGACDIALAVGVDKLFTPERERRFQIFDGAWDVRTPAENHARFLALAEGLAIPADAQSENGYSPFMDVYAGFARQYMRRFGITQRQLAVIASKNRTHAVANERAQFRKPMSVDEVLASPPITWPLTLPMCSPISDGAGAALLCTEVGLRKLQGRLDRAIQVHASVLRTATARDPEDLDNHLTRLAANQAYEAAGFGPEDMHVAEVHDATAMGELIQSENLGFCPLGEGGAMAEHGETTIGGRIPINPSGGLESKGHPIGATGLGQVYELVSQLRGECGARQVKGARMAVHENGGGIWGIEESVAHIGIYGSTSWN
ncbi:thiolase family protein [Ottowia thiooxydans]|uniref:Acetyl-CoA acyltransferase n=1 Tax=Ottowia thiooxydans TaxID=219182 RepID=A0ABV2QAP2_9BURK